MYGVSLEVFLNVSLNRRFLENVWKLLGFSSLKDSRINSSLGIFRKLKLLTENSEMLLLEIIKKPHFQFRFSTNYMLCIVSQI